MARGGRWRAGAQRGTRGRAAVALVQMVIIVASVRVAERRRHVLGDLKSAALRRGARWRVRARVSAVGAGLAASQRTHHLAPRIVR